MNIWVGTSGWSYKGWAETFYPQKCPASKMLAYYATQFPTVEINATFYRLATTKMSREWHDQTPEGFLFAVKGSRYITHMRKLVDIEEGLERFFDRTEPLKERTGPILWQLPPFLHKSAQRLENFLQHLPEGHRHAVEFRHDSWICDEIFEILRRHNVACAWISSNVMPMDFTITADFIYGRFHGLEGGSAHNYTKKELEPWAEHLVKAAEERVSSYIYFNNDVNVRAPLNAKTLMGMVGHNAVQPHTKEMALASS